uniref:Z band alternatively spliced PDZ-motif protein 52, isoform R n=1 Tax=Drosophila melanogaster TaxID=7227 RepID=G3JX27_DROME|nr:Z band alternatively spliced PDZ-motif protein 52, isoform R [Drosophila melanogaster]AEO00782.1 Z-band PDZ-motif protein 52 isoform 4 [Drosophila melanogaster]AGB93543.1 Z band alternatively spliced PDZ-motif protein 52, isoform R [Drosophila melanogaster]|eukprot:NP_001261011.1 Z band alternatively spliced PDZ-motif protein 52, isoform R [Drosophila melanogaster]
MAQPQLLQIKLSRFDAQPWGFRLQGGTDFAQPLLVQKVNAGSLSEQAGLQPGDAVVKINDVDVFNLRHKDAQDIVVRSGNNFVITVQRGGSTWRPHVTPTGNVPQPNSPYLQTVTKTSLAHKQQDSQHIGCGYNNAARPFSNGGDGGVKSIVNKQYNTPVGIYSDESIAETLSAQAEVLAGGVLGVNFKKNEKEYQGDRSEVLKFLREEETGQSTPAFGNSHYEHDAPQQLQQPQQQYNQHQQHYHQQQQQQQSSTTRHVSAPVNSPKPPSTGGLPTGQNICTECERLITGVFVRIKDKNLHVECFKCATCGTSLKNQGYYNFNNKLYCDIHAKQAAINNPPTGTEGYVPVPIKPNTKLSASTISSALNSHGYGGHSNGYSNGNSTPAPAPVNQGYARPFGAAAPKSPVSYPPQQQQQSPRPAPGGQNPYATLPRSNVGQQGRNVRYQQQQQQQQQYNNQQKQQYRNSYPMGSNYSTPSQSPYITSNTNNYSSSNSYNNNNYSNYNNNNVYRGAGGKSAGAFGATSAPKRGRGILNKAAGPGVRIPLCNSCNVQIRGPFITALGRIWCPDHFICVNGNCRRPLQDIGFVEEKGDLYCEYCFEKYLAPTCSKCAGKIKGDCLNAIGKHFHPECFTCGQCGKIFGNRPFFLEDGNAYCEADWNELFTTKCFACGFPVEAGDRWVEALNHNYHSQCFNCTFCKQNLEGQSFYNKGGRPFCKNHAR